jgi:hypothetical protein
MSDSHHAQPHRQERPHANPHLIESFAHAADWLDAQVRAQQKASARTQDNPIESVRWHSRAEGMSVAAAIIRNLLETQGDK